PCASKRHVGARHGEHQTSGQPWHRSRAGAGALIRRGSIRKKLWRSLRLFGLQLRWLRWLRRDPRGVARQRVLRSLLSRQLLLSPLLLLVRRCLPGLLLRVGLLPVGLSALLPIPLRVSVPCPSVRLPTCSAP